MTEITHVGVVGCGAMGSGIAEVCARAGYQTIAQEVTPELAARGLERVQGSLRRAVERGRATQAEMDAALSRIRTTTDLADLAGCQLIIEAVVEETAVKRQVFVALDRLCPPTTIFASNTSSLPVVEIAAVTDRLERFVGLHFFNPAPVMPLVELVRTLETTEETLDIVRGFAISLGKTVVETRDSPGFVVNRLLIPYLMEAVRCYEAGLASRDDIDNAMKLGLGHPMGPLALLDLVGLDVATNIANILFEELKMPHVAPPPLLKRMVQAGYLGRKTGRGFYEY